jgi:hypothetical protein
MKFVHGFIAMLFVLNNNAALAAGAVAEGIAPGGVQKGYSLGISSNQIDEAHAKTEAVATCQKYGDQASQKACHVVTTFTDQCATVVEDPKNGTPGAGWAIAPTMAAADEQATARCKSTAGSDRQSFCTSVVHECDGSAKK